MRTAGPQPGTFLAQWAPLDLNLGPAQLSVHRWTSTWDLPSSGWGPAVRTELGSWRRVGKAEVEVEVDAETGGGGGGGGEGGGELVEEEENSSDKI